MGDAPRAAKLARLGALRNRLPHISQSGLAAVLQEAARTPFPTASRQNLRDARRVLPTTDTEYGSLHRQLVLIREDGSTFRLEVQNPFAMLHIAASTSVPFCNLLKQTLQLCPCDEEHPWKLILYQDEVTPGRSLAHSNMRKFFSVYWSIVEFSLRVLQHEESWFFAAVMRSCEVSKLDAGISYVVKELLAKCFFDRDGFHLGRGGVALQLLSGERIHLYIKMGIMVGDSLADSEVWMTRGPNATLPCAIECANCVDGHSGLHLRSAVLQPHWQADITLFAPQTDASIRRCYMQLLRESTRMLPTHFTELQQRLGIYLYMYVYTYSYTYIYIFFYVYI